MNELTQIAAGQKASASRGAAPAGQPAAAATAPADTVALGTGQEAFAPARGGWHPGPHPPGPHPPAPRPPHPPGPHPPEPRPPHPPGPHPPEPHPPLPPGPHPPEPHPPWPGPHPPEPHPPHPPEPRPPWPGPHPPPWPGPHPPPNDFAPVQVDAAPYYDSFGNPVAVTDIDIRELQDPYNATEQQYPADVPQEEYLTLYTAHPYRDYDVGVSWADGSRYDAVVRDYYGGMTVPVNGPNQ